MPAAALVTVPAPPGVERRPVVSWRATSGRDASAWSAGHAGGRLPDASPYGLHRLAEHGLVVAPSPEPVPSTRLTRRLDGTLRHRGAGWEWWSRTRWRVDRDVDLVACWDERTGIPALTGVPALMGVPALTGRTATPVATGVIWLTDTRPPAPWAALARDALRRAAAVWALSSAQLAPLREHWGVPDSRVHHLPFGVDETFWSPRGVRAVDGPPVVLGVGNDRHRDHAGLVAAVAGLPARLSVVSRAPVDVPPSVGAWAGPLDHVALRDRYETAAVVAVLLRPNLHVSGVTTVLEAQAMGRPVVVSDTPGMRDYVEPGVTAELVPVGDVDAARTAVAGLLADPDRARAMGEAGRRFVARRGRSADTAAALADILRAA